MLRRRPGLLVPTVVVAAFLLCSVGVLATVIPALQAEPLTKTPFGKRLDECVLRVRHDTHVAAHDMQKDLLVITHPDGVIEHRVAPSACHDDMARLVAERETKRVKKATGNGGVPGDGWYDNAEIWHYSIDEHLYKNFTAKYTVPPSPIAVKDQTLFYFIGLEDMGYALNILQPVLTFNQPAGSNWSVSSWACCPANITVQSGESNTCLELVTLGRMLLWDFSSCLHFLISSSSFLSRLHPNRPHSRVGDG